MNNDELAKHQFERASAALFEAGKSGGVAFLLFCVLLATTSVLVFVGSDSATVTLPIFGLNLPKWKAAEALIVISCAAYFQTICLHLYQRLLYAKLELLLPKNHEPSFLWYYYHPSMFFFLEQISEEAPGIARIIGGIVMIGTALGGFLYPLFLIYLVGEMVNFSAEWWATATLGVFFQFSGMIFGILMTGGETRKKIIQRLEKY